MSLKVKLLAIMATIMVLTFSLNYSVLTQVVAPAFNGIEEDEAKLNLHRVTQAIEREIEGLAGVAVDYSHWDESYTFATGENPTYMDDQVGDAEGVLPNLNANLLAYYDTKGQLLAIRAFDLEEWEEIEIAPFSNGNLPADHVLLSHPDPESLISGIYMTRQGPMLVGSSPILTNESEGPIAGSLIFASYLNESVLEAIAVSSGVTFDAVTLDDNLPANLADVTAEIDAGTESVMRTSDATVSTFATLSSLDGNGGVLVQAKTPRDVSQVGTSTVEIALISILLVGLLDLLILWVLIQKFVIKPVGVMKQHAIRVSSTKNLKDRMPVSGTDELSVLADKYNEMLGDIETSNQELKDAQDELVKQERLSALGELTATVSHEIRNPLGSIRASLFLVQQKTDDVSPEVERALERADRNIERCANIIDELLEFVQDKAYEASAEDADAWFKGLVDAHAWPEDITVTQDFAAPDATVKIDLERVGSAVSNLLDNAIEAMRANPAEQTKEVSIATRLNDGRYEIVIGDNGPGMDEEGLKKIFQPLYSTKGFGVGLGIPIVQKVLHGHGGDISYDSAPGKGTRVTLWIPLAAAEGKASGETAAA